MSTSTAGSLVGQVRSLPSGSALPFPAKILKPQIGVSHHYPEPDGELIGMTQRFGILEFSFISA